MELMRACVSVIHKRVKKKSSVGLLCFFFEEGDTDRLTGTGREEKRFFLKREREKSAGRFWCDKKKRREENADESSLSRAVVVHRRERVGTKAVARGDRRKRRRSFV